MNFPSPFWLSSRLEISPFVVNCYINRVIKGARLVFRSRDKEFLYKVEVASISSDLITTNLLTYCTLVWC